jgi:chromosome partitioning protein
MSGMTESCSVCGSPFDVQFRYQMEETSGGFSFHCSQACLKSSQVEGSDGAVGCDGCGKRFRVELVTNVFYVNGFRRYACSMQCRAQLANEGRGVRLGEIALGTPAPVPAVRSQPPDHDEEKLASRSFARSERARAATHPQVVAVFNHKGGTGKTTTSVQLAAGLALRQKRVLLVDTDAQGNVGVSFNIKAERSLYHVLVMGVPVQEVVVRARDQLDVLPCNESLAAAELYLAGRQNRDRVLARRLESAKDVYDVIVLDCSPSLSLMNQNALVFADAVLVPVACDYLSLVGVRQVIRTVKNVNQHLHHPVQIWGILPTFYDGRTRICRDALETLREHFGDRCLSPVRATMKIKEAPAEGQTIFEYAAASHAAEDYRKLVEEFLPGAASCDYGTAVSA